MRRGALAIIKAHACLTFIYIPTIILPELEKNGGLIVNKNKRIWVALLLAAMLLTMTACGGVKIVGKWKMDPKDINAKDFMAESDYAENSLEYAMAEAMLKTAEITMEFTEDARLLLCINMMGKVVQEDEKEYKIQGDTIFTDETAYKFKINGDKLTLLEGENTLVMTRE